MKIQSDSAAVCYGGQYRMKVGSSLGLLLVLSMALAGCRSTIYRASACGDVRTVRAEIARGADVSDRPHGAHMLWVIPAMPVTIAVDIAQLGLAIGTLGLYAHAMDSLCGEHGSLLTVRLSRFLRTPVAAAMDNGHEDVVRLLVSHGATLPEKKANPDKTEKPQPEVSTSVPVATSSAQEYALAPAPACEVVSAPVRDASPPSIPVAAPVATLGKDYVYGTASLDYRNSSRIRRMLQNGSFATLRGIERGVGKTSDATDKDARGRYDVWYYFRLSSDIKTAHMAMLVARSQDGNVKEVAYVGVPENHQPHYLGDSSLVRELELLPTTGSRYKGLQRAYDRVAGKSLAGMESYVKRYNDHVYATLKAEQDRKIKQEIENGLLNLVTDLSTHLGGAGGALVSDVAGGSSSGSGSSGEKTVTKRVSCSTCSGKGSMRGTLGATVTCPNCNGSGKLTITETTGSSGGGWKLKKETCTMCKGGKTIRSAGTVKACPGCAGRGYNNSIP